MAYTNRGTSEILVGGGHGQNSMFTVNLDRGTVLGEVCSFFEPLGLLIASDC